MRPAARQDGFALLIVLWAVALLSLMVTQISATARSEAMLARNLRTASVAAATADAAIQEAVFHVLDTSPQHWAADGTLREMRFPQAVATVRITSEAGKINPNNASPLLLQALLRNVGADQRLAQSVAAAIVEWRLPDAANQPQGAATMQYHAAGRDYGPPGAPFGSIDDIGLVLGVTPELLARLKPNLTIAHDRQPDPFSATSVVLHSLHDVDPALAMPQGLRPDDSVVQVVAAVTTEGGARFVRRAVARIGESGDKTLFHILAWEDFAG